MPDLEEMGAEGSPAMTSHAGMETTFAEGEGSGGRASLSSSGRATSRPPANV